MYALKIHVKALALNISECDCVWRKKIFKGMIKSDEVIRVKAGKVKVKVAQSCLTLCDPMDYTYSPWDSPGQNTGVGSLSLLQGNLPNPGIEPRSPALQADSLPTELSGKPQSR